MSPTQVDVANSGKTLEIWNLDETKRQYKSGSRQIPDDFKQMEMFARPAIIVNKTLVSNEILLALTFRLFFCQTSNVTSYFFITRCATEETTNYSLSSRSCEGFIGVMIFPLLSSTSYYKSCELDSLCVCVRNYRPTDASFPGCLQEGIQASKNDCPLRTQWKRKQKKKNDKVTKHNPSEWWSRRWTLGRFDTITAGCLQIHDSVCLLNDLTINHRGGSAVWQASGWKNAVCV